MSRRQRIVASIAMGLLGLVVLVVFLALSITQTEYGQGQVRRLAQSWISKKARGTIYIGQIRGGLFNGVTIDSLEIRDEEDSLFIRTGRVRLKYDLRDIVDRRILLSHLEVNHLVVHVRQHEDGTWNYRHIFPKGPEKPLSTSRGLGDFILMDSADVRNATIAVTQPWHPADYLRGYQRDSSIRHALGSLTRVSPGNQWHTEIRRTREGYARTWRFTGATGSLGYARIADPDSAGRLFRIATAQVVAADPPLTLTNVAAEIRHVGDSIWLTAPHFDLPGSTGRASGKIVWGGGLPTRYALHIVGDSVSIRDVAWVYSTLPVTGGGRMELDINNWRNPRVIDFAISKMDLRTTGSRLLGNMTYGVGGRILVVK
ncbi:MAG: hypothetical protein ABIR58_08290, partial [Gemmatimonadaceae bacterium]